MIISSKLKINSKWFLVILILVIGCESNSIINDLSEKQYETIYKITGRFPEEEIYRFYSCLDLESCGNFFSNKRVVSYWITDKEQRIDSCRINKVDSIKLILNHDIIHTHFIEIYYGDNKSFTLHFKGTKEELEEVFDELNSLVTES